MKKSPRHKRPETDLGNFSNSIYGFFKGNVLAKQLGTMLVTSSTITKNPLYAFFYWRKIRSDAKRLSSTPPRINVEVTNYCNSDCVFCPRGSMTRKQGSMQMTLFKKIVKEAAKLGVKDITLSFMGEPLLDKTFLEKIMFAKKNRLNVSFFSNASLIDEVAAEKIVSSGTDSITISIDALSEKTFQKLRRGISLNAVEAGIEALLKKRNELNSVTPAIFLNFIMTKSNQDEINGFAKKWQDRVESINFAFPRNFASSVNLDEKSPHISTVMEKLPCRLLWTDFFITWDGKVVLCCEDFNATHILGDISKQKLAEIFKGQALQNLRKMHLESKRQNVGLCQKCTRKTIWW